MAGFTRDVNTNPAEIPRMPLEQKKECMTEIEKVRDKSWMFSVVYCLGIMAFFMVYGIISTMYTLKAVSVLPSVAPVMIIVPVMVFVPALLAHSMKKRFVILTALAYFAAGVISVITGEIVNGWVVLPSLIGSVVYFGLYTFCDSYQALEKEEGFPDFCDIRSQSAFAKEVIERNKKKEEPLNPLTELAIAAEKSRQKAETENEAASDEDTADEE